MTLLVDTEGTELEPSALAGLMGPLHLARKGLDVPAHVTHLIWATGGNMVPHEVRAQTYQHGKTLGEFQFLP